MHVEQSRILLWPTHFEQSAAFYEGIGLTRYREWGEVPQRGGGFLELNEGPPPEPRAACASGSRLPTSMPSTTNCAS
jgi:hypothetical protein